MSEALLTVLVLSLAAEASASVPKDQHKPPTARLFQLWDKVKKPLPGEPEPIGTYTAGCLSGARALPLDGEGYSVMRPSRLRYYGHESLVNYIEGLGKRMHAAKLQLLLVGDMGRPRGGPMRTGHSSHQIGLDADLWFELGAAKPTLRQREDWGADPFANLSKNELSPAWSNSQRTLVRLAAEASEVDRLFVHPTIKRDLCKLSKDDPWQHKVRAWWNHHDHLHVRLRCPSGVAHCVGQEALDPAKNGCGTELDWWFSEEAKEEGRKNAAKFAGREFPELPEACGRMVMEARK